MTLPSPAADVIVVGSLNLDCTVRCERLPQPGETLPGHGLVRVPGGKGANQAVAAARLGARVALLGCVGDDDAAGRLLGALAEAGVATGGVQRVAGPSGLALVQVAADGENQIVVVAGANAAVDAGHVLTHGPALAAAAVVLAQLETPLDATRAAFEQARAAGARTVLNASPMPPQLAPALLALSDWLVVNRGEAARLLGMAETALHDLPAATTAARHLAEGRHGALLTLGAGGLVLAHGGSALHLPAEPAVVVDTTGAGDTLAGAFCAALAAGLPPPEAAALGQRAASRAVSEPGAQAAMPGWRALGLAAPLRRAGAPVAPAPALPVLFDTDPGIDDAMALLMLRHDACCRLLGVTTVFGNAPVETTTRNAQRLCAHFDIRVPVAQGAARPLQAPLRPFPTGIHGADGLGGVPLPDAATPLDPRPAHVFICDMLRAAPGEVVLVAVGPLTNLALALRHDPGITQLVRRVVVMGGAFGTHGHRGNVTPFAEANIACDPHAAAEVFAADWPLEVVGLDVTERVVMSPAFLGTLAAEGGRTARFVRDIARFYSRFPQAPDGGIFTHDPSAVACALQPALFTRRAGAVRVLDDGPAAGQTLQWPAERPAPPPAFAGRPQHHVCVDVDAAGVLQAVRAALVAAP